MVKKNYIIFLILIFSASVLLQEKPEISSKKDELSLIKQEILSLEKDLKEKSAEEKKSYQAVENYNRQNFLINKLINKLKAEEQIVEKNISESRRQIDRLEDEIKSLQKNYEKYVVSIYKYGKANELAKLFDAESVEQALIRYKYLQRFSNKRQEDLKEFESKKDRLSSTKIKLEQERNEKRQLAESKIKEEKALVSKLDEKRNLLALVRKDKSAIKNELDAKKNAEEKIRNLITRLIEEEERRKEAERLARLENEKNKSGDIAVETNETKENYSYDFDLSTSGFTSFANLKGRMNWPISGGKIIKKFGENRNSQLNTVTLNYGVDIKAGSDKSVKAVAEGVVSAIDWIPGYGSVIILSHKGDYRTVYSHLAEIHVKEGDKVSLGSALANVGESIEGHILHFEIWNSRNNQNPEVWLVKK